MGPAWDGPTAEDVMGRHLEQGRPVFNQVQFDHLAADQAERLGQAVAAARQFVADIREKPGQALLLVAQAAANSDNLTGFGCGKTLLASCIYSARFVVRYLPDTPGEFNLEAGNARFYEARELMALFEQYEQYNPRDMFADFGRLLLVDDVGREGMLRWEKRDEAAQLDETQARYYSIINHCYEKKISLVMTSNLSGQELNRFLGGASWSRLLQMAPKRYRLNLTGLPDYRSRLVDEEGGDA